MSEKRNFDGINYTIETIDNKNSDFAKKMTIENHPNEVSARDLINLIRHEFAACRVLVDLELFTGIVVKA